MPGSVEPAGVLSSRFDITECSYQAMATTFRIQLVDRQPVYARQAAAAAFEELHLLQRLLSRYEQGSDVSRINRLSAGEETVVALETFECLRLALHVQQKTGGVFDVTYASKCPHDVERFRLDPTRRTVQVLRPGVQIDLGGIGKGFALDRMAHLLGQWDIASAMLWASTSTVLAFGTAPGETDWSVTFGPTRDRRKQVLRNASLSASGTAVKGRHVIHPRTGRAVASGRRTWAAAPTAAMADALSTAWMVTTTEQIRRCCRNDSSVTAYLMHDDDGPLIVLHG